MGYLAVLASTLAMRAPRCKRWAVPRCAIGGLGVLLPASLLCGVHTIALIRNKGYYLLV